MSTARTDQYAQPLLLLTKLWCVWTLARGQHVYSESGPAVHFLLWITVHTLYLIPVQNGFTSADRKQFIALTSLVKIQTNWKLWLLHMVIEAKWSRPHALQLQDVWQPVCIKLSEIDHVIPFVLHWTITCSGLDWDWCTPCSQAVVPAQQLGQHWSVTGTTCAASCFLQNTQAQSELWASSPIRRGEEARLWFLLSWGYNVNSKPKFEMPLFEIMLTFGSSELH